MLPNERQRTALAALNRMHGDLITALRLATEVCSPKHSSSSLTVDSFLCGLYLRDPRQAESYFDSKESYQRMVQAVCGRESESLQFKAKFDSRYDVLSASVRLDDALIDIFSQAAEISSVAGQHRIGMEDFMQALSLKRDVTERLSREWALKLKAMP